jgi:Ca-activated chloride channel homolog
MAQRRREVAMRRISMFSSAIAAFLLLASGAPRSEAYVPHRHPQSQPTFTAESNLVVLHVSVRDRGGRYVTGLQRDAFTVIDDGKPQTLEMFSGDEVPASVGFLIDNSNSMRANRERVIASAVEFVNHSHKEDEIFVLTFNERVRPAFGPVKVADMNMAVFGSAMSQSIIARGMTAIYDGILEGVARVSRGIHTRQVLIVVSDGDDNASTASVDDVIRRVHDADAVIYTIALTDPLTRDGNPGLMRRLARATGGESYQPHRLEDVDEAFERIARDVRSAYTLAYAPTASKAGEYEAGRRRAVRVYVRSKDGRALRVRTRDGYFERSRGATP